jgi:acyl-CoA hydrolase
MAHLISPQRWVETLTPGQRIYVGGCGAEPTAVLDALATRPDLLAGSRLTGVFIPGVNRRNLAAVAPDVTVETFFVTPALREAFAGGRARFLPLHYSEIAARYRRCGADIALFRTSPPRSGMVSLGTAHDFAPAVLAGGARAVGVVDETSPFVPDGVTLPCDRFEALIDGTRSPVLFEQAPRNATLDALARHVARLVSEGDTVQVGIGAAPGAVLAALRDHRGLACHAGLVSDGMVDLLDCGALTRITAGAALGTQALIDRIAHEQRIAFRPVEYTHDVATIGAIPSFVAVNAALEVDLFGQVNGETIDGRQVSGHGGMVDFVRGARRSPGGRAVTVLAADAMKGSVSRIVPALAAGTPVSVARADTDVVVTEHGIAELREADIDTRAERLIAVAAPRFRNELAAAWDRLRRAM